MASKSSPEPTADAGAATEAACAPANWSDPSRRGVPVAAPSTGNVGPGPAFEPYEMCGITVTVPPVCPLYMKKVEHDPQTSGCAALLHIVRSKRPPCPLYQKNACSWGKGCWYPHVVAQVRHPGATLIVQFPKSHKGRVKDYIVRHGGEVLDIVRAEGQSRRQPPVAIVKTPAGEPTAAMYRRLTTDKSLCYMLGHVVRIDAQHDTVDEAVSWLAAACKAAATPSDAASVPGGAGAGAGAGAGVSAGARSGDVLVRVSGLPKSLEPKFADKLSDVDGIDGVMTVIPHGGPVLVSCLHDTIRGCNRDTLW